MGLVLRCEMEVRWDVRCAPNFISPSLDFRFLRQLNTKYNIFWYHTQNIDSDQFSVTSWAFSCFLSPGLWYDVVPYHYYLMRR